MKTENRQFDKRSGSALILVVVVTVLLAVLGVMFLMVTRAAELETGAVIQSKDLDSAVDTVVAKINDTLVEDLFVGNSFDPNAHDAPIDDPWLCDLEPDWSSGVPPQWDHPSDLYATLGFPAVPLTPQISSNTTGVLLPADADGDGVTDSYWVQVPTLTTSRGEPIFTAVRIIDNCAMLNLNTAYCFYQNSYAAGISPFSTPWFETLAKLNGSVVYHNNQTGSGRYLTEMNYMPFLRGRDLNGNIFAGTTGGDLWYNLMIAKGCWSSFSSVPLSTQACHNIVMSIESPGLEYRFFDISDELELRNRYLLTSKTEARFERDDVANYSLDSGGGIYAALRIPRDSSGSYPISDWYERINPDNFDAWDVSGNALPELNPDLRYRYDRRHVCTFYSYDRTLSRNEYPLLLDELTNVLGWSSSQIETNHSIFRSVGPVTTDIRIPASIQPYNNIESRRRILHLLFAFREYFYQNNGNDVADAAKKAAQVVANLIDYADDNAIVPTSVDRRGPFYDPVFNVGGINIDYGQQANADCTFITKDIIDGMITEVSVAYGITIPAAFDFGFPAGEIVFGYEKQPFISEVAADWNGSPGPGNPYLEAFGVELVNPYPGMIDLKNWQIKIGTNPGKTLSSFNSSQGDVQWQVLGSTAPDALGHMVLHRTQNPLGSINYAPGGVLITDPITDFDTLFALWSANQPMDIQLLRPAPQWVSANLGIDYIVCDTLSTENVRSVLGVTGVHSLQRDDDNWKFIFSQYAPVDTISSLPYILGEDNTESVSNPDSFQIGTADDLKTSLRWHDLEVLGLYGNGPESDPNSAITSFLAGIDPSTELYHFDIEGDSEDLLNYITPVNRPDLGSLPGRININTAPVYVIAAAIPPTLADPNAADPAEVVTMSALQLAQRIVEYRESSGPFSKISDLLNIPEFVQYSTGGAWEDENVGMQSIDNDIEEEHWVLSNLANKFTVRSDVFTAYILVRLGAEGPQRRMIAIFDRSQVWDKNDRPKLVALHPVPDPR